MGTARAPERAKLFTSIFSRDEGIFPLIRTHLERTFGPVDFSTPAHDFTHTDYYTKEFGTPLKRQFFAFAGPCDLERIYKAKIVTNRIEARYTVKGKRIVNIDPGYLTLSKVVLLTTKDYTHRLYIGKGIFAEVTLHYRNGTFNAWPWTYPDYKTGVYREMFNTIRQRFHQEILSPC